MGIISLIVKEFIWSAEGWSSIPDYVKPKTLDSKFFCLFLYRSNTDIKCDSLLLLSCKFENANLLMSHLCFNYLSDLLSNM